MIKSLFSNRRPGFYLAFGASALAIVGVLAYLIVYFATAGDAVDRVFDWLTFGFMLCGGVIGILGETLRLRITPILAIACVGVGFAQHLVESAYPLADVLTGVPFFGGNFTLALIFAIVFGLAAVCLVVSAFMEHNKTTIIEEETTK